MTLICFVYVERHCDAAFHVAGNLMLSALSRPYVKTGLFAIDTSSPIISRRPLSVLVNDVVNQGSNAYDPGTNKSVIHTVSWHVQNIGSLTLFLIN